MNLKGFTDSDWAGLVEDRRRTSGNCFLIGSAAILWSSKTHATVALSSTEAEYVATTSSACQAVWLRRILCDLSQEQMEATDIFCDDKYVEIKHHFIGKLIARGEVNLKSCRTEEQLADLMTKSLPQSKHEELCSKLGVSKFE